MEQHQKPPTDPRFVELLCSLNSELTVIQNLLEEVRVQLLRAEIDVSSIHQAIESGRALARLVREAQQSKEKAERWIGIPPITFAADYDKP